MFRRHSPKIYPPGTFVETPLRVMAIVQLCIAFTLICWNMGIPFMGDHFVIQRKMRLVETVATDSERFVRLPLAIQSEIMQISHALAQEMAAPLGVKLEKSLWQLLVALPAFELAWIVFAVVIAVMVLKKRLGARQATWLLPLIATAHLYDNIYFGVEKPMTVEGRLYPTEQHLVSAYFDGKLADQIDLQHEQLKQAWQRYVVKEWLDEEPSHDNEKFETQIADGEYLFTIARAQAIAQNKPAAFSRPVHVREPLFFLILYLLWNGLFAYVATKPLWVHRQVSKEAGNIA